jgi:hypothetical protein
VKALTAYAAGARAPASILAPGALAAGGVPARYHGVMRLAAARRIAALVVAAASGIGTPALLLTRAPQGDLLEGIASFETALGPLHEVLGPGAVVGLGLNDATTADPTGTSPEEYDRLYFAQYALAPALVLPIPLRACVEQGPAACGADRVTHLILLDVTPDGAALLSRRLGFRPVSEAPGFVFLARTPP